MAIQLFGTVGQLPSSIADGLDYGYNEYFGFIFTSINNELLTTPFLDYEDEATDLLTTRTTNSVGSNNMLTLIDMGSKIIYKKQIQFGLAFSNDKTMLGMIGYVFEYLLRFRYSYDFKFLKSDFFNPGSNKFVLRIQLFNKKKYITFW